MARRPLGLSAAASGLLVAGATVIPGTVGLMAHQMVRARRSGFLPRPGYRVDVTVDGPWTRGGELLRVAFLGDSLVEGVGAPLPTQSLPAQTAYRLSAHLHAPIHMRGYGIASSRVSDVLEQQAPHLDTDVDLTLVMIGANDATHATPPWEFGRRLEQLIDEVVSRTGAPVVLFGLPDIHSAPLLARPLKNVAALLGDTLHAVQRRVAARHPGARYVPLREEIGHTFRRRTHELFASDRYHPNPNGYALIAEATARSVAALLREESASAADESTSMMLAADRSTVDPASASVA